MSSCCGAMESWRIMGVVGRGGGLGEFEVETRSGMLEKIGPRRGVGDEPRDGDAF
jgi:hypothetical protein